MATVTQCDPVTRKGLGDPTGLGEGMRWNEGHEME